MAASEIPDYDELRRTGIYLAPDQLRVAFTDLVADPLAHPLAAPSGRVELASQAYIAQTGFPATPHYRTLPPDADLPLRLITPKPRLRIHSQCANIAWFTEQGAPALCMRPTDAIPRGINNGQPVLITSPEGRVRIPARVSQEIMPSVVCLQEGFWPAFDADGVDTGGSAKVLTSTVPTEPSQGSRTHSVLVQVCRVSDARRGQRSR